MALVGAAPPGQASDDLIGRLDITVARDDDTLATIARRHGVGYVELEGIRRQRTHEWQRQASLDFARGRTFEALQAYAARGAIRFHDTADAAHKQIVADWADARRR